MKVDDDASEEHWQAMRRRAALAMQMDIYVSGSQNVARIQGRARQLENMFLDMRCLRIQVGTLNDWGAALWVRSRVNAGTKSAGATARTALTLAERFTGEKFFAEPALVKAQAVPKHALRAASEPPEQAPPPPFSHVEVMEAVVTDGATPQQRAYAGFFAFLAHASHRCDNGQRTRRLHVTDVALLGESLMKRKKHWTKCAAAREGLTRNDWAGPWLSELNESGLPGEDFILLAANVTMDAWLQRPARYHDFSRALHLLLMVYAGEKPEDVINFTPHGYRHFAVTAGTQLAAQGIVSRESMETLGHWEKGSKMPERYDAASCVTELYTRKKIADVLRSGWRPAADGSLPVPVTPAMIEIPCPSTPGVTMEKHLEKKAEANKEEASSSSEATLLVYNNRGKKLHVVRPPSIKTMCNFWTCGTVARPTQYAEFEGGRNAVKCETCFRN